MEPTDLTTLTPDDTPAIRVLRTSLAEQQEKLKAVHIDNDETVREGARAMTIIRQQERHVAGIAEAIEILVSAPRSTDIDDD